MIDKLTATFVFGTDEKPGHEMEHMKDHQFHELKALLVDVHYHQGQHTQLLEKIMSASL